MGLLEGMEGVGHKERESNPLLVRLGVESEEHLISRKEPGRACCRSLRSEPKETHMTALSLSPCS